MQAKLLEGLNAKQHQAVISTSETILCLAGAGSGKTTVLTTRIAHLFDNRVGTSDMLALTFTRLAGKEMKERVIRLIGEREGKKLFCNTFHAFAVHVLKDWGHLIGIDKNFTIYDQEDRKSVLEAIIKELGSKATITKTTKAYEDNDGSDYEITKILKEYKYRLRQNNALDLDKLISVVNELWSEHPEALNYYKQMYSHVFVDEFQDSSDDQMDMFRLLAPKNLFVVGDDFQAIYGWRGAKVEYILDFPNEYPNCEVVKLEDNYRSTKEIVAAANNLISHNVNQSEKTLIAHKEGPQVTISTTGDERMEYEQVLDKIRNLYESGTPYKGIAVLSRTNMQLKRMQEQLEQNGIPNIALGRNDIMRNRDMLFIVSWLQVIVNNKDGRAFNRALSYPEPFLSEREQQVLRLEALKQDKSELAMFQQMDFRQSKRFFELGSKISEKHSMGASVAALILYTAEVLGVIQDYKEKGLENRIEALENGTKYIEAWQKTKETLGEDNSLSTFLKWLKYRDIQEKLIDEKDAVKLMTMHGSKGLEFDVVFLVGLVEGTFPSKRGDIEEERRLAYVGVTRAKKQLFLSHSLMKQEWNGSLIEVEKSRFLDEIKN
ncbi:UvrD-helicase domain-containing protein [Sporosarcina sp. resist]|uniref:ATP-dependent helicase n=1 Tax=Sporosarcina sp. resist TaxID=2762563 RepID=UPI00164E4760|nr:UvrD-helicase domain-containing protein [Sporosarcina sp. resist]QNK87784.1 UvrD-helicase domain-containing protein [Sporosarcina sp. resist]